MKIIDTFAIIEDSLYAVQYEHETEFEHEWARCFNQWNNPIYLRDFFETHINDLENEFWKGITIEEAIKKTRGDAKLLENKLLEIAKTGKTNNLETLSTIFEPLSEGKIEKQFEKDKVKGTIYPSWLRIYAIRVSANVFVVSGGDIKLTKTMNDREHLITELKKLELTKEYLTDDENDNLDIVELY